MIKDILSNISYSDQIALEKPENSFDETVILKLVCYEDKETENTNTTAINALNSLVEIVKGSYKSLSIVIDGEAPFMQSETFDSSRPFLHLTGDQKHDYLYQFCPNVTQGSDFKKWSLVNIWSKDKSRYSLSFISPFTCPHPLFNQTLIIAHFNGYG